MAKSLRTNLALLESATDELTAHFTARGIELGRAKGDLIGAIQTAIIYMDGGNNMAARARLARALQENKL